MDWDRLPPFIVEKIIYYATDAESGWYDNRWLESLEKFGRVSEQWKSIITTSEKLLSDRRNQLVFFGRETI